MGGMLRVVGTIGRAVHRRNGDVQDAGARAVL
jgi:hypothetical protein